MGLKDRNNPLGQRTPSDQVGAFNRHMKHDQSAELVEEVRRKAKQQSDVAKKQENAPETGEYDTGGPDRQPGQVMKQSRLGKEERKPQLGQYTQDNEEEPDHV